MAPGGGQGGSDTDFSNRVYEFATTFVSVRGTIFDAKVKKSLLRAPA